MEAFDCLKEGATAYGHEEILAIANRRASSCCGHPPAMEGAGTDKDSACRACCTGLNDRRGIDRIRRADRVATVSRVPALQNDAETERDSKNYSRREEIRRLASI